MIWVAWSHPLRILMTFTVAFATHVSCTLSKNAENVKISGATVQAMTESVNASRGNYILKS